MTEAKPDLLDIADQISIARNFVDLIHLAHARPEGGPTATAAFHVSGLLQVALDMLSTFNAAKPKEGSQ
ncbi:hypothetical protein [Tabrizicola oligotrophica]|uniref:DUF3077 domain-containing protein n=1 Tax=Tabrizicola oligotrophica TaxID=2710650 RepID=A0A6M0QSF4_9RHOB|nr:hypothetical protein [Tabrizicola oligotrophica]NEY90367.1 hypothetical protein [Tabrizicola oligotrophica]